uniref:Uncharacterized protein n=1 Tax=Schlesneria paludicola TaxID=360056 RepID=A0A7C2P305_9PLAN
MASRRIRTRAVELSLEVTVVAIDSNYEPVTKAAYEYRERHVYPYLTSKGFRINKFQGTLARRYYVAPAVREPGVDYITGVGHGLSDLYTGDQGDVVFRQGDYHPDEAAGKIVHLLSCQTARELGPDFVQSGCRAYFGYDVNFTFYPDDQDIFFECDSEIDKAFADGLSADKVYARVKKLYDKRIAELYAAGKLYVAAALETDRDHLRCPSAGGSAWGDPAAKLS